MKRIRSNYESFIGVHGSRHCSKNGNRHNNNTVLFVEVGLLLLVDLVQMHNSCEEARTILIPCFGVVDLFTFSFNDKIYYL
jgi:hypothetical protein